MKKSKTFKRLFTLGLSLSLVLQNNFIANATTHSCTSTCFKPSAHVHSGVATVKSGCYQGTQTRCNTVNTLTEYTQGYGSCGGCTYTGGNAHSYTIKEFTGVCKSCGGSITATYSSHPPVSNFPGESAQVTCSRYTYSLSCGKAEGDIEYAATMHSHEGSSAVPGGCYQGSYVSGTCGGQLSYTRSYSAPASGTCTYCGATVTSVWVEVYTCSRCHQESGAGHPSCCGGSYNAMIQNNPNWNTVCKKAVTSYSLSCGKTAGVFYNTDGSVAEKVCNKIVMGLVPLK